MTKKLVILPTDHLVVNFTSFSSLKMVPCIFATWADKSYLIFWIFKYSASCEWDHFSFSFELFPHYFTVTKNLRLFQHMLSMRLFALSSLFCILCICFWRFVRLSYSLWIERRTMVRFFQRKTSSFNLCQ